MYSFELINEIERLLELKPQWDRLLDVSVYDSFFCCHEWIVCWWQNFALPTDKLTAVKVEKDGNLVALAPLMIRTHKEYGFRLRVLKFIGVPNSDRCDLIIAQGSENVIPSLVKFLIDDVPGWCQFHLNEVPQESLLAKWLQKNRCFVFTEDGSECPYVDFTVCKSWNEFYASLSRKTRLELNRKNNRFKSGAKNRYFHQDKLVAEAPLLQKARAIEANSSKSRRIENLVLAEDRSWKFQQALINNQSNYNVSFVVFRG